MKTQEEYLDEYISLMEVARNRPTPEGYTEKHHIFPKSWMPNDYIVVLTAQEHFIAHYLLSKAFPEDNSMAYAFWGMCNQKSFGRDYEVAAEIYAEAKKAFAIASSKTHKGKKISEKTRQALIKANTGRVQSDETKEKIRASQMGKNNSSYGRARSEEELNRLRKNFTGRKNPMFGKKLSSEHIAQMISSREMTGNNNPSNNPKNYSECPHCGKGSNNKGTMTRFHFDNCKTIK